MPSTLFSSSTTSNLLSRTTATVVLLLLQIIQTSHCYKTTSTTAAPLIKLPQRPSNRSINRRSSALRVDFYSKSCPQFEQLVSSITSQQFKDSPVSAPATIRLFFHDCFVEGCDGSILISVSGAEREAEENKSLAKEGFAVVDKVKALVETKCPGIVSCADVLAIAARDFVHLTGGPYYQVKKGRWDGKISKASRVGSNIPRANSTIDQLLNLFASKGLSLQDMVALSGAHTIGFSHCNQFLRRLYNYKGTNKPDPSMDLRLLKALRMSCPPFGGSADVIVPFDVAAPFTFDNAYYGNLEAKMGLLSTDQGLLMDERTRAVVVELGKEKKRFFEAFGEAMEKMGGIGVKRGRRHGEKRKVCSQHML
ncbi:hypothetical protein Scep_011488 [Stephania cephalantha]|uniref:Peroxidase n=1 Tax=Stephania cephalantha TaxID=152367 RepID=A0AAP0JE87_9MAGN